MKPVSLANITYEQGLHLLQMRKEALDRGESKRMSSQSLSDSFFLRDVGNDVLQEKRATPAWLDNLSKSWNKQPLAMQTALVGGGLGALGGIGKTVADEEDDGYFRNAITGGLAGGFAGGGLGLAIDGKSRKALADRFNSKADTLIENPRPLGTAKEEAVSRMQDGQGEAKPFGESAEELAKADQESQGLIPWIDRDWNNLPTATEVAAKGGPASLYGLYNTAKPAMMTDTARAAVDNIGGLNPTQFAQAFEDANDAEYKRNLNTNARQTSTYDAAVAQREQDINALKRNSDDATNAYTAKNKKPVVEPSLPTNPATGAEFTSREMDLGRTLGEPDVAKYDNALKKYKAHQAELDQLKQVRDAASTAYNSPPSEIPMPQRDLRQRYVDSSLDYTDLKGDAIEKFMREATDAELAAFQRLEGMSSREIDQLFRQLKISEGDFAGESAIKNLNKYLRGTGENNAVFTTKSPRTDIGRTFEEIAAATPTKPGRIEAAKTKLYPALRAARRAPKGRAAILAALTAMGYGLSERIGFTEAGEEARAKQRRRMDVRDYMAEIYKKRQARQEAEAGNQ